MTKIKLAVTTKFGTVTRTTAREYSHVVVVMTNATHHSGAEVGSLGWSASEKLAAKTFDKYAALINEPGFADWDAIALYTVAGELVREVVREGAR